jgi:hypothetical protein
MNNPPDFSRHPLSLKNKKWWYEVSTTSPRKSESDHPQLPQAKSAPPEAKQAQ